MLHEYLPIKYSKEQEKVNIVYSCCLNNSWLKKDLSKKIGLKTTELLNLRKKCILKYKILKGNFILERQKYSFNFIYVAF